MKNLQATSAAATTAAVAIILLVFVISEEVIIFFTVERSTETTDDLFAAIAEAVDVVLASFGLSRALGQVGSLAHAMVGGSRDDGGRQNQRDELHLEKIGKGEEERKLSCFNRT